MNKNNPKKQQSLNFERLNDAINQSRQRINFCAISNVYDLASTKRKNPAADWPQPMNVSNLFREIQSESVKMYFFRERLCVEDKG